MTEFQRNKISHYFRIVLDQDKNGVLDENDFREIGESLCILWNMKPDTPEYKEVIENSLSSWRAFKDYFKNKGIEADEKAFLAFCEKMLSPKGEDLYKRFVIKMVSNLFYAFDINEDGIISVDEYSDMFMCYHIPIKFSAKAFVKLDRDGDEFITKKELMHAVDEFFKSNNEDAPGNWLFGFWGEQG